MTTLPIVVAEQDNSTVISSPEIPAKTVWMRNPVGKETANGDKMSAL